MTTSFVRAWLGAVREVGNNRQRRNQEKTKKNPSRTQPLTPKTTSDRFTKFEVCECRVTIISSANRGCSLAMLEQLRRVHTSTSVLQNVTRRPGTVNHVSKHASWDAWAPERLREGPHFKAWDDGAMWVGPGRAEFQFWGRADAWPRSPRESLLLASRIAQKHLNLAKPAGLVAEASYRGCRTVDSLHFDAHKLHSLYMSNVMLLLNSLAWY